MRIRGLVFTFLLSVFLILQNNLLAFSEELNGFEFTKIIDTGTIVPGTGKRFAAFGPPQISDGKVYFVGTHIIPDHKGRDHYLDGLYVIDENGLRALIDFNTKIPGDKKGRTLERFQDFAVLGKKIIFSAGDGGLDQENLYLLENGILTILAGRDTKVASLKGIKFKHFGRMELNGNTLLFEGGPDPDSGLFLWRDGQFSQIVGEIKKRRKKGEPRTYIQMNKLFGFSWANGVPVFVGLRGVSFENPTGNIRIYQFKEGKVSQIRLPDLEEAGIPLLTKVGTLAAHGNKIAFSAIDKGRPIKARWKSGGHYIFDGETLRPFADRNTNLWNPADTNPPGPKDGKVIEGTSIFIHRLYFEGLLSRRKWHNITSIFVDTPIHGVLLEHNIAGKTVYNPKRGKHRGDLPYAFAEDTILKRATVRTFEGFNTKAITDTYNFILNPIMLSHGNLTFFGEDILFHGTNLEGQEGLFFSSGDINWPFITNEDFLFGEQVRHLFIGAKGTEGAQLVFWTKIGGAKNSKNNQAIILAERITTP